MEDARKSAAAAALRPDPDAKPTSEERTESFVAFLNEPGEAQTGTVGEVLTFDGTGSYDSDGAIERPVSDGGFGSEQRQFADVIQYLNDADLANGTYGTVADLEDKQNVISYFIVDGTKINTTTTGYARAGGTGVPLALNGGVAALAMRGLTLSISAAVASWKGIPRNAIWSAITLRPCR